MMPYLFDIESPPPLSGKVKMLSGKCALSFGREAIGSCISQFGRTGSLNMRDPATKAEASERRSSSIDGLCKAPGSGHGTCSAGQVTPA